MAAYTIQAVSEAGFPDWAQREKAPINRCPWPEYPTLYPSFAQLAAAGEGLHVRLSSQEPEPVARHHQLNDFVCRDSCLEFFFQPVPARPEYFNFEFNCEGTLYLGIGKDRQSNTKLFPQEEYRELFRVQPFQSAGEWGVAFFIPTAFIGRFLPEYHALARHMRGNFYKCGDCTPRPHYQCWSGVAAPQPDFHRPECFGDLYRG